MTRFALPRAARRCFALPVAVALAPLLASAQTVAGPDCPPLGPDPALCISLDARKALGTSAPDSATFQWHLGDGQTRDGARLDYCYAQPGQYRVRLDVLDPRTRQVRPAAYTRQIELAATPALRFRAPDTAHVGQRVVFSMERGSLPQCLSGRLHMTWTFGEGNPKDGENAGHTFRTPGTYRVRLHIKHSHPDAACPFIACATHVIRILP